MIRKLKTLVTALMVLASVQASAEAADRCAGALTQTGRNQLLQVSQKDREAYHFRRTCEMTGVDSDGEFSYAKVALGLTYSSRREYCDAERSRLRGHEFDYTNTSTVVESALRSWLACVELTENGIQLTPVITKGMVQLSLRRQGTAKGLIRGLTVKAPAYPGHQGATCRGVIKRKSRELGRDFNFKLPSDEEWTITCERNSVETRAQEGDLVYPETEIGLDTSQGGFSITLQEEPVGSEVWATEIYERISAAEHQHSSDVARLKGDIAGNDKGVAIVRRRLAENIELYACEPTEFFLEPRDRFFKCPDGKVMKGFGFGGRTRPSSIRFEMRMQCCRLRVVSE